MKLLLYWDWIKEEARRIKSDGCSNVPDFHVDACWEHDLSYWYAKCPRSAYKHYCDGVGLYWSVADSLSRGEADAQFRRRHQERSVFGKGSPMALWRWAGVRLGGWKPWSNHRKVRS